MVSGNHQNLDLRPRPVLVVGTDDWAISQAAAVLADAGVETLTCHPPGEPTFPCNAFVAGRTCPLDQGFDVVVTVRARPVDTPTVGEIGVVCGVRAGAALVTAGMAGRNPFASWATRVVVPDDDLVAVVNDVLAQRIDLTRNPAAEGANREARGTTKR